MGDRKVGHRKAIDELAREVMEEDRAFVARLPRTEADDRALRKMMLDAFDAAERRAAEEKKRGLVERAKEEQTELALAAIKRHKDGRDAGGKDHGR